MGSVEVVLDGSHRVLDLGYSPDGLCLPDEVEDDLQGPPYNEYVYAIHTPDVEVGVTEYVLVELVSEGHELPQEMGDYGILIYAGFDRVRALTLNFLVALSVVVGGVFATFFLKSVEALSGILISFSAGAFLYLSASELVPELQYERDFRRSLIQFGVFILGMALIYSLGLVFPHE